MEICYKWNHFGETETTDASDSRRRSVFLFKTRWNARTTDFADEMSSRDESCRATTRYRGIGDRTIDEGVTEGRKKATSVSMYPHLGSGVASRENDGRTDQNPVYPRLHLVLCNCRWAHSRAP